MECSGRPRASSCLCAPAHHSVALCRRHCSVIKGSKCFCSSVGACVPLWHRHRLDTRNPFVTPCSFQLQDVRVNYCYTKFENGRCQAPKPANTSKEACCCTGMAGQGWGDPCEICPIKGEGDSVDLSAGHRTFGQNASFSRLACSFSEGYTVLCRFEGYQQVDDDDRPKGSARIDTRVSQAFLSVLLHFWVVFPPDIDECVNNPCVNGQCINTDGSFRCECPMGYNLDISGIRCEGQ